MLLRYAFIYSRFLFLLVLSLLLTACSSSKPSLTNSPNLTTASIFVNQIAFNVDAPKTAIITLPEGQRANRFIIYQDQNMVYQGALEKQPSFTEWGQNVTYYVADFSSVKRRGEFHLVVNTHQQQLISSTFSIDNNAYFKLTAQSILSYLHSLRDSSQSDKYIRLHDTTYFANLSGGWMNSAVTQQKSLIQLPFSTRLTSQQISMTVWALAKSYTKLSQLYDKALLTKTLGEEVVWGADFLHRSFADNGFFYMGVYGNDDTSDERLIVSYDNSNQVFIAPSHTGFSEGAGMAIASLVRAYELSDITGIQGKFSARQYLVDAERAFFALQTLPRNEHAIEQHITTDYTALIAASELYRVTKKPTYLVAARIYADKLNNRSTSQGWFSNDNSNTPYYHPIEAGFPVIALVQYLSIERNTQRQQRAKQTIKHALNHELNLTSSVSNPFNLARQSFNLNKEGDSNNVHTGFFMPHNEAVINNWQGENSRIASLTAAAIWGGQITHSDKQGAFGIEAPLANFAQSQMDWVMGKNPYNISMLYGFGIKNPEYSHNVGIMLNGGISNGITGATANVAGITWAEGPDEQNWRWLEQPLANSLWYLLAISAMSD